MLSRVSAIAAVALLVPFFQPVLAQVHTDCNPLLKTCPPDPAFGMDHFFNFNATPSAETWETTVGPVNFTPANGAEFTINKMGDSPTIRTKFYFFFGRTEIFLKVAKGKGIISSMMWLSDDLDEVDWEFVGVNNTHALSNYFGKGVVDYSNGGSHAVPGAGTQDAYHNYTSVWTRDMLQWFIDGQLVRTLLAKDANNTKAFPQTPMRLSLGIWAGGDPRMEQGTRDWAGGDTDYNAGPYTMYVKSARIQDASSGKEYVYGDKSGTWQSIKAVAGNSTVKDIILAPPPVPEKSIGEKFNDLSPTAKIAIYSSAGAVGAAFFAFVLYYCIKQRRRGAREAKLAAERIEKDRHEMEQFKREGIDPDSFTSEATEYNAHDMNREGLAHRDSYSIPATPATPPTGGYSEKAAWETAAIGGGAVAAAGGMRSPVPLLRDGSQSPRVGSPGPQGSYHSQRMGSSGGLRTPVGPPSHIASPLRTPSPGMPPQFPPPASPHRSASQPNAYMRVGSPAAQQAYGAPRMQSPAPMTTQSRSFTAPRPDQSYGNGGGFASPRQEQSYGNGGGYATPRQEQSYGNGGGYSNGPSQGYW